MNILRPVYFLTHWFKRCLRRTDDQKQLLPSMITIPIPPNSRNNQLRGYQPQVENHLTTQNMYYGVKTLCFGTTVDGRQVTADFFGKYGEQYCENSEQVGRYIQDAFPRLVCHLHSAYFLDVGQSYQDFYKDWASRVNEKLARDQWVNDRTITCRFTVHPAEDITEIEKVDVFNEFVLLLWEIFKLQESESIFTGFYLQCHRFVTEPVRKLIGQLQLLNEQLPVLESRMTTLRDITGSDSESLSRLMDQYRAQRDRIHLVITESLAKMMLAHGKCVLAAASTHASSEALSVSREIELLAKEAAEALQEADDVCSGEIVHLVPRTLNS